MQRCLEKVRRRVDSKIATRHVRAGFPVDAELQSSRGTRLGDQPEATVDDAHQLWSHLAGEAARRPRDFRPASDVVYRYDVAQHGRWGPAALRFQRRSTPPAQADTRILVRWRPGGGHVLGLEVAVVGEEHLALAKAHAVAVDPFFQQGFSLVPAGDQCLGLGELAIRFMMLIRARASRQRLIGGFTLGRVLSSAYGFLART